LIARIVDRFGKGIRTAPRDAMVAESADKSHMGKAFGLHKGLDLLGTAIGILLAWLILSRFIFSGEDEYRTIFIFSIIPAIIGLIILFFVKDKKQRSTDAASSGKTIAFNWKNLNIKLKMFLIFIFIFTLGNSSNAFIILRAVDAGFSKTNVILLYFLYNITGSLLSLPSGLLSDKFGRKNLLCVGYFLYGIVYLGIALMSSNIAFIALFVIYGFYTALTTGAERALIVDIVPPEHKAGALGLHAAIAGIALLPASVIAGFLWKQLGPSAPFLFGGILAFITCIGVFIVLSVKNRGSE
jgi:MFS family permease